ncbi:MAG: GerW family sporulation protein [Firmicutes bacterium]|nr:GerW family sporulation protein [Bacillota bacterium]
MSEHAIQGLMQTAMESLKGMIDVNTVVGDAVETKDGTVIVPVSRVAFGFAAGGSDWPHARGESHPFGGGSGAGVSVQPVAFLVVSGSAIRLLPVGDRGTVERLLDMTPEVLDRLQGVLHKNGGARRGHPRGGSPAPAGAPAAAAEFDGSTSTGGTNSLERPYPTV